MNEKQKYLHIIKFIEENEAKYMYVLVKENPLKISDLDFITLSCKQLDTQHRECFP